MYQESLWGTFKSLITEKKFKIVLGVLLFFLVKELIFIGTFNGKVSKIADGYSESNTIRGGTFFAEQGFTKYSGLPDLCYTDLFPDKGFKQDAKKRGGTCHTSVYTHYPPGSEYLIYPSIKVFGNSNLYLIRLQPIFFNFFVSLIFLTMVFTIFPLKKAMEVSLILMFPQMFHNYWHGLHHQGYAFSFMLLQLTLVTMMWHHKSVKKIFGYPLLFLLGFLHGWMTFDYAFIASFFSLPLFFYFKDEAELSIWDFLWVAFFSGLGFTAAHGLHFIEVANYYGSYQEAYNDLFKSAQYRANNYGETGGKVKALRDLSPGAVVKDYLWRTAGRFKYTGVNLINYVWIVLGLKLIKRIDFKIKDYKFEFNITRSDVFAILTAIFVAGLWSMVMRQHAYIHGFIARHYYLVYLFCTLVLIRSAKKIED
jgi:hypothetical protein